MDDLDDALTESREGTIISLEVSAGAKTSRFPLGYNPWRKSITCQVRAPPIQGKANAEVIRLISEFFSLPGERVKILSGSASSQKRILLAGLHQEVVLEALKRTQDRDR